MEVRDFIGTKYKIHGRTLEEGLDCYGVIYLYYKEIKHIELPDPFYQGVSSDEKDVVGRLLLKGLPLKKIDKPKKESIIFISGGGKLSHIGLYLGEGQMLHSNETTGCIISNIQRYSHIVYGYYEVIGEIEGQK